MPAMKKQGYDTAYCAALVSAAAVIGPIIPPSIPMIVYGVTIGASVGELFIAGVIPGIIIAIVLMVLNYFFAKKRGYLGLSKAALAEKYGETSGKKGFRIDDSVWALIMPVIVLGGIYGGVFTPTEAAAVGVMYSVFVGKFIYKELDWKKLRTALLNATELTAVAVILLGGANTFGRILTLGKIPQTIAAFIMSATENPVIIMLFVNVFLLITGMFIDTTSNILLFAPLFWPLVQMLGYDAVYFGIIMTINLCIGMLTPPVGVNLFVGQTISGAPLGAIMRDAIPFLLALILTLTVFIVFPQIVMFLPNLLYG
ncbi:TRAP transporter large permease [Anaerotruncus rubiinfantis]|nr:TRAP transporter large permease [Anaerotruncus rubiinfantis]